jgi:hypothetical protein
LARQDEARGDFTAAIRNLQTAATFEPGNVHFKNKLQQLRAAQEAQRRGKKGFPI